MEQIDAAEDRDPKTGVIRGAEAITLQPGTAKKTARGTACLMIHGFAASRDSFGDLGERLADQGVTVRMMRLPGHGTTPRDFAQKEPADLIEAVREEYLALKKEHSRVSVVGFSLGAALATILASEESPDRLVLLAPYYRVRYYWYYVLPTEAWTAMVRWFLPYVRVPDNMFAQVNDLSQADNYFSYKVRPTSGAAAAMKVGKQARNPKTLQQVDCPVLMILSRNDQTIDPKTAEKAFTSLASKSKRIIWLTRSDHMLCWDFDREEVKDQVVDYLTAPSAP